MARRGLVALLAAIALVPAEETAAVSRAPARAEAEAVEAGRLKAITDWLQHAGRDGYLAADVADAAGIPRAISEELLEAKQLGFRTDDVLRIAQVPADARRDFLLFMVQRPDGEVYFYLANVREGLKKAFVFVPAHGVAPLDAAEAQASFRQEIRYWEARVAGS